MDATDERIETLGMESAEHGDLLLSAICAKALGTDYSEYALTRSERALVDAMTAATARAECEYVIRAARARVPPTENLPGEPPGVAIARSRK